MRLIDAEKLKHHYAWWGQDDPNKEIFDEIIHRQPTVDAEIIRHGRWIKLYVPNADAHERIKYKCSLCERYEDEEEPYCNCGAKMDLEYE